MLPKNRKLKPFARDLRNNATRQESHLWFDFLRSYPVQFYRQMIIKSYIVDFYCAKARLVVELDGFQHYTEKGIASDKINVNKLRIIPQVFRSGMEPRPYEERGMRRNDV